MRRFCASLDNRTQLRFRHLRKAVPYAGSSLHDEVRLLDRAGLTPLESLQTATINPARYLGLERDLHTIAKGKLADVVLLRADRLLETGNSQKIDTVIVNGHSWTARLSILCWRWLRIRSSN